jgi:translation elongation factor EF-G
MAAAGRPVGHLRVTLIGITIHPVDAKARRFVQAAEMALTQAFEKVGVEL